jgi:hypothetical protein
MANAYLQGIQNAIDNQAQIRNDISVVAINWFVNRCPLVTRVPRLPSGSTRRRPRQACRALSTLTPTAIAATPASCTRVRRSWKKTNAPTAASAANGDASAALTAIPCREPDA